jgi:hypothetical protein
MDVGHVSENSLRGLPFASLKGKRTHKMEVEAGTRIENLDFVMRKPEKRPALRGKALGIESRKPVGEHLEIAVIGGDFRNISGIVTLSDGKTPAAGVLVAISKEREKVREYKTVSSDGRFLFDNLPTGIYTLLVKTPDSSAQTEIEIKAGEPVLEIRIQLVKDGTIELFTK